MNHSFQVFITFVYIQVLANWFCVKYFHSYYNPEGNSATTQDNSPWEDFETNPRYLISGSIHYS